MWAFIPHSANWIGSRLAERSSINGAHAGGAAVPLAIVASASKYPPGEHDIEPFEERRVLEARVGARDLDRVGHRQIQPVEVGDAVLPGQSRVDRLHLRDDLRDRAGSAHGPDRTRSPQPRRRARSPAASLTAPNWPSNGSNLVTLEEQHLRDAVQDPANYFSPLRLGQVARAESAQSLDVFHHQHPVAALLKQMRADRPAAVISRMRVT
jgi:hypothetical protein